MPGLKPQAARATSNQQRAPQRALERQERFVPGLGADVRAGHPAARGQKGAANAYNIKNRREEERRWVEQAETAYARFVAGWNPRGPKKVRTGAATEVRR